MLYYQWHQRCPESTLVATASPTGAQTSFFGLPFDEREVMPMYVTWELLFLFAGFILSLLAYVDSHNKKD